MCFFWTNVLKLVNKLLIKSIVQYKQAKTNNCTHAYLACTCASCIRRLFQNSFANIISLYTHEISKLKRIYI